MYISRPLKYGFILPNILPTNEWYIFDRVGLILDKGGIVAENYLDTLTVGSYLPEYWVKSCCNWYSTLEELFKKHTVDML